MSKISATDFEKALGRLNTVAKSQLFSTPSDSEPASWAGSKLEAQDAFDDMIDDNGTDYEGSGVAKALAAKVAAGHKLTKGEAALLQGKNPLKAIGQAISSGKGITKAEKWALKFFKGDAKPSEAPAPGTADCAKEAPETHAGSAKDDEVEQQANAHKAYKADDDDDDDMDKSLAGQASLHKSIKDGIEMSSFLADFIHAADLALRGNQEGITKALTKSLAPLAARLETLEKAHAKAVSQDNEFKKALAEAVVALGNAQAGTTEIVTQQAQTPVSGPRSVMRTQGQGNGQVIEKSFDGNPELAKSQMSEIMVDLVKSGKLNPSEVVKFESGGEVSAHAMSLVRQAAGLR